MKTITNMLIECTLVSLIIIYFYNQGNENMVQIFSGKDGAGAFIACFGILWAIGAFVRLSTGWGQWLASLSASIGLIVFGYTLHDYGLFYAFCATGGYCIFLGYIAGQISPDIAMKLFIIGVILLIVFLPFRNYSVPTKPLQETFPEVSCPITNGLICCGR